MLYFEFNYINVYIVPIKFHIASEYGFGFNLAVILYNKFIIVKYNLEKKLRHFLLINCRISGHQRTAFLHKSEKFVEKFLSLDVVRHFIQLQ